MVSVSDADYTAPAGVTEITLIGSQQSAIGNDAGDSFHANNNTRNVMIGGAGSDTFHFGLAGDTASGNGGADTFAFDQTPWVGSHITDFNLTQDRIDLTGLLAKSGYSGPDPIGAGYVKITQDTAGNAQVWSDLDKVVPGAGWYLVTTVDHVAAASLHMQGAFITG